MINSKYNEIDNKLNEKINNIFEKGIKEQKPSDKALNQHLDSSNNINILYSSNKNEKTEVKNEK